MEGTVDRARGRWREILPALGVESRYLSGKHMACPACGGMDRFRFDDRSKDGDYFCSQCGAGKGVRLLMKVKGWDFATAAKRVDEIIGKSPAILRQEPHEARLPDKRGLRELWTVSRRMEAGDPVATYLAARGIDVKVPRCIRYVPEMDYRHEDNTHTTHPGMIATFSDKDGKPFTLHRTYLTKDGRKADLDPNRKLMPGRVAKGGAVRLAPFSDKLGIAEGIETAMSASIIHDVPVWAALNEVLLRAWEPPKEVKYVVVFGDNDENFVGQASAYDLAKRLATTKKISVEVRLPKLVGHDWNDALRDGITGVM